MAVSSLPSERSRGGGHRGRSRSLLSRAPALAGALAVAGLALLLLAPIGWRAGWWNSRVALGTVLPYGGYLGLAAAVVAAATLGLGWHRLRPRRRLTAAAALVLGLACASVPWQFARAAASGPNISDISTDVENPPDFRIVLAARKAEESNPVAWGGPEAAKKQLAAYPDIAPVTTALPPLEAYNRALGVARAMRWQILDAQPESGQIEASQASLAFGFVDDIVIRVKRDGAGSRIDIRSTSRHGRNDGGVNSARVRSFLAAVKRGLE